MQPAKECDAVLVEADASRKQHEMSEVDQSGHDKNRQIK
jgi:hypothetical protein